MRIPRILSRIRPPVPLAFPPVKRSSSILRKLRTALLALVVILALAALAAFLLLRHLEAKTLFHPAPLAASTPYPRTPADVSLRYQDLSIRTETGGRLAGWWIPARAPKGTVVVCNGSFETMADWVPFAPFFQAHRLNLLLWDYPGYGRSVGALSERSCRAAAAAAVRAAADFSPSDAPILLYGHGIGASFAASAAAHPRVSALVLESPFASAADLARRLHPSLPLDRVLSVSFDAAAATAALPGLPKLVAHSPSDEVLPFASARLLADSAAAPKSFAVLSGPHGAHAWFDEASPAHPTLLSFLDTLEPRP